MPSATSDRDLPKESFGYIVIWPFEVVGRVERIRRVNMGTVIDAIFHTARTPQGPSRCVRCTRNARSVGLEEIEFAEWAVIDTTTEQEEEDEETAGSEKDKRGEAQDSP